jgi:hypothetical protein
MKKLVFGIVMFCGALLTSCAPSQLGTGQSNPITLDDLLTATVPTGGTWYVKVSGPVGLIDLRTRNMDMKSLFTSRDDVRLGASKSTSVRWFSQTDVTAPSDWGVELVAQNGTREVKDVDADGSYSALDSLDLIFAVRVPQNAKQRLSLISVQLVSRSDGTKTASVPFIVNIGTLPGEAGSGSN